MDKNIKSWVVCQLKMFLENAKPFSGDRPEDTDITGFIYNGIGLEFHGDVAIEYRKLIEKLSEGYFSNKYSISIIENKIQDILTNISQNKKASISSEVETLFNDYDNYKTKHRVYIPLYGLAIKDCENFGDITILRIDKNQSENFRNDVYQIIEHNESHSDVEKEALRKRANETFENIYGKIFAQSECIAEPVKAKQLAEHNVATLLDYFNYCSRLFYPKNLRVKIGLEGDILAKNVTSFTISSHGLNVYNTVKGPLADFDLTENISKLRETKLFVIINNALSGRKLSDLNARILKCIHWYAKAVKSDENNTKLLNMIFSLESLLSIREAVPISAYIAESISFLLGKKSENRKIIYNEIKRLHMMRSTLVHGGKVDVSSADVLMLESVIPYLLYTITEEYDEMDSIKELNDLVQEIKFS